MPSTTSSRGKPTPQDALALGLHDPPTAETARLAAFLAAAFGPSTSAIIHYGSHAQRSDARPESAHDFFVIVDQYRDAYRSLVGAVRTRFSARTASALARVLQPNVLAITLPDDARLIQTKCAVLTTRDLERACSDHSADHFTKGRLFQQVQLVWTRDAASRTAIIDAILAARRGTFAWARDILPPLFDADTYCRVLLERSFAAEIRPEGSERIAALLEAQRETLTRMYEALLQQLATERIVIRQGNVYRQISVPRARDTLRLRLYFRRSKARATLRWLKHMVLYENWLDYIVQKIARRGGTSIELTARERRWPLIFLWPKALRYLRSRPQRRE